MVVFERIRHCRVPTYLPISVQLGNEEVRKRIMIDISLSGACLYCRETPVLNTPVIMYLPISKNRTEQMNGVVKWVHKTNDDKKKRLGDGYIVGVCFEKVKESIFRMVRRHLTPTRRISV
ncbi:MAG: PilZ domain-containing protein [Vulcanimicrobiota bacterium]